MDTTVKPSITARIRKGVVYLLAFIGLLNIAGFFFPKVWLLVHPEDANKNVRRVVLSPDKKYKAVAFNYFGGSAANGYCFDYVSVAPASLVNYEADSDRYHVYKNNCQSLGERRVEAPIINWVNDSEIKLTYDIKEARSFLASEFLQLNWDFSKQISVIHAQVIDDPK